MKTIVVFLGTLFILAHPVLSQTDADLGVAAIGLVVSDIEASETFYKDVLGMTEVSGFSLDEEWSKEAGAANNKPFSVKMFKMKDLQSATILKLAYFKQVEQRPDLSGVNVQSGVNYITFNYTAEGFSEVMGRVDEAGIEKIGWVKREGYQLVFIKDPDGIFIEIVGPPDN